MLRFALFAALFVLLVPVTASADVTLPPVPDIPNRCDLPCFRAFVQSYADDNNLEVPGRRIRRLFEDADSNGNGTLGRQERTALQADLPAFFQSFFASGGTTSGGTDCSAGFVRIPAGTFWMGSRPSEPDRRDDEIRHEVRLTRSFCMQQNEVTQGQYEALMGTNPSHFSSCGDDCPVEQVTWEDATAYANALSTSEGLTPCYDGNGNVTGGGTPYDCAGYRLPTEAEWEYAARAGTNTAWYAGSSDSCVDGIGWYQDNSSARTHLAGRKDPNAWGLFDMTGNVQEWVWDWRGEYPTSPQTDPTGPSSGVRRINRGGNWFMVAHTTRSAARFYNHAVSTAESPGVDVAWEWLGFRLARTAP